MPQLFNNKLASLQHHVDNIRNICILAHVDHGKTSLADSLVAANGVISARLAGKLRYMDSRKDEQERGITMKSSSISLFYPWQGKEYLVNLMDSPGHVDFSSEVCTAVRLCDGAIVVVDIVEGVQPQTKVVLEQAWDQGIKPILVLNKIDRLFTEKKLDPPAAYLHISQVLVQINAVMGELFAASVMSKESERKVVVETVEFLEGESYDWSSGLEEADDSQLYFSPEQGNVVFASAVDGWAFSLSTFAEIYSKKLSFSENVLKKTLWGDYYINVKEKKIMKGASLKGKKVLFVQLVLDNIWAMYETVTVSKDKAKLEKMVASLGLKVAPRDLRTTDSKQQLMAVMSSWLPVSVAVLSMVCDKLPSPARLGTDRAKRLMCAQSKKFDSLPQETQALLPYFETCHAGEEGSTGSAVPTIAFVSKMFPMARDQMPENRAKPLTEEEMAARRSAAREKHQERMAGTEGAVQLTQEQLAKLDVKESTAASASADGNSDTISKVDDAPPLEFIAFARVFSGSLRENDEIWVLGPKFDPSLSGAPLSEGSIPPSCHASRARITGVYMLLGRDLEKLEVALPGNVVGLSGLAASVIKSATLCSSPWCPPFVELVQSTVPILRVAVEPARSSDILALNRGLQILNQADAHVEVIMSESGENLLLTAGEVHLQRCILDLTESYAKCEVSVSEPIVPFRETVVPVPDTDMVNEFIEGENRVVKPSTAAAASREGKEVTERKEDGGWIEWETPNKQCQFLLRAVPLPKSVLRLLEANTSLLKVAASETEITPQTVQDIADLRSKLAAAVAEESAEEETQSNGILEGCVDRIMCFGPKRCGPNILVNATSDFLQKSVWSRRGGAATRTDPRADLVSSVINGFQLATLAGPICEEPVMGVAFVLQNWELKEEGEPGWGPLSGQIVSSFKECCRRAMQAQPQRLMVAMYSCEIAVKAEVLGRMYGVISKRRGQVVSEEMVEGSSTFTVTAHIPVIESMDLTNELRKQTSGLAMPQLVFSHWETLDIDPYWEPQTEEELTHYGEKADSENPAKVYMNSIKRRKGLKIDEKIVEFAEKQRTLTKSK